LTKNDALADQLAADYEHAAVTEAEKVMLRYADKLTRAPSKMTQGDVDALVDAGFSHAAILDICMVTAYFAFANRLVDGLGLELESPESRGQ
jgi:uncharacterized peroxidase-related enzyme